jgi:hypothetical protein
VQHDVLADLIRKPSGYYRLIATLESKTLAKRSGWTPSRFGLSMSDNQIRGNGPFGVTNSPIEMGLSASSCLRVKGQIVPIGDHPVPNETQTESFKCGHYFGSPASASTSRR